MSKDNIDVLTKKVVVTGGGSGGHISSAKAVISELEQRYILNPNNFLYIGSDLGMEGEKPGNSLEMRVFANEKFNKKYIRAGKLQRQFSIRGIYLLLRTLLGFFDTLAIFKKFKPDIVISTGGFVSVPVCLIAKLFKADIYLHEQTATVGLTNRIVGKFAKKIFLAYPLSQEYFPKDKTFHTGNPLRDTVFQKSGRGPLVEQIRKMLEIQEEYPIIYVSGGSLGSHVINQAIKDSLVPLLHDFQIILQTGDNTITNDYKLMCMEKEKLEKSFKERFLVTKYVNNEEIGFVLNNTNFFLGRAGANTVYEMGVLQIPSILIPIPWVTHNEQNANAQVLKSVGLATIINEAELTPEKLQMTVNVFSRKNLDINKEKAKDIFLLNAQKKIIDNISFN